MRFLLHGRDAKFCRSFGEVFRSEGAEVLLTPVQPLRANAFAERWVRTVRTKCLDWLVIVSRGHLEQVLRVYVRHDDDCPHRGANAATAGSARRPDGRWQGAARQSASTRAARRSPP